MNLPENELKHFFIVHQCLLPMTTGHEQNIKESCFRYAHIRVKSKPLHIADRRNLFPNDLDGCIGHAGKNFKRSRKVDLIHLLEDQAAHR